MVSVADAVESEDQCRDREHAKKQRQVQRWVNEVLPGMFQPYLRLLRTTASLRNVQRDVTLLCSCAGRSSRSLTLTTDLETINIKTCHCSPAALQLVARGLFPCAPQAPTLAVDISLLQFTHALFVRLPPNTTSFCETLEVFLESRNYKLASRITREQIQHRLPVRKPAAGARRASEYLHACCPLCFGSDKMYLFWQLTLCSPDVIVCLDVCFTQKCCKGKAGTRDPPRAHPDTVFVPEEEVKTMEDIVECTRRGGGQGVPLSSEGDDIVEGDLKLPNSVLDGCNDLFTAADEHRQKASTQFFADTGLMAMLCWHNQVLWLVNMTSAGEKQHYALVLVRRLFDHLPTYITVGLLYDIACQLHRSIVKWGFLGPLASRLMFAISVFHVFGHQWPCQLVYHPRKCTGFGLSDGEGCERFWSSIQRLIPSLRYHQRLFMIDTQLGHWLHRKWYQCESRLRTAQHEVQESGFSLQELRDEWRSQVEAQTKPAPKWSNNRVAKMVEAILALQKSQLSYDESIRGLEEQLLVGNSQIDYQQLDLQLSEARGKRAQIVTSIMRKRAALGVDERAQLARLTKNKYLQLQMNACALKQRIQDRLHQRKFELDRFERSYRQTTNKHKLSSHVESAVKRQEPGILKLAKSYNMLCEQILTLVRQRKAPHFALAPEPIQSNGLFKLDVDDDIWQDVGLEDDDFVVRASGSDESQLAIPRWLGDEAVRSAIKAQLILDRCIEERDHLSVERCTMQQWMQEEWRSLEHAIAGAVEDPDLEFQLIIRRDELCRLCVTWQKHVSAIPGAHPMSASWGPSECQLNEAALYEISDQNHISIPQMKRMMTVILTMGLATLIMKLMVISWMLQRQLP
ncbi:uncharacterized protein B0H18DRAFT_1088385 [Fomitopsis serialis]|uniref:uncharacterized protein n=1 Tax=Fomitopsis serialis TaxID=139415 RepID=UPI002007BCF5|nr:uncharacterized protein B0H18DRAFT_1088385 [Neoantrodia serialis]KAH9912541.1 hypothetical protein B0H18DRAFT_1088385 [Neoantrodia serialis]